MATIQEAVSAIQSILTTVQPLLDKGNAISAALMGGPCDWYRPRTKNDPISDVNHLGILKVLFDSSPDFSMKKPRSYKESQLYGAYDRTETLPGDYFVDQISGRTYFINSQESLTPSSVIITNIRLTFYRATAQESRPGAYVGTAYQNQTLNEYGGNVDNLGDPLAANWPASMLNGTKGGRDGVNLPNQSRSPWYNVRLPAIPGVMLETDDLVIDSNGNRYLLSGLELTELGWNLSIDQMMVL